MRTSHGLNHFSSTTPTGRALLVAFLALITTLVGCGSDRDNVPLVRGSNGVASISGEAVVGETLSGIDIGSRRR